MTEKAVIPVKAENAAAWDHALSLIEEKIIADVPLRNAVRDVCWWLTEEHHDQILGSDRIDDDPVKARIAEMRLRGVAAGIGMACDHLTDNDRVREVRAWIRSLKEAQ